jgi:hypothetical protein
MARSDQLWAIAASELDTSGGMLMAPGGVR